MQRAKKMKITDLNPSLMCRLCHGYLVDATTIVECLHSFCKTCIVKFLQEKESHKYCPTCEVQMHKTKPLLSIRSDKALQDIVYKLVPGLFKAEMKRRRDFYSQNPNADLTQLSSEDRGLVHEEHFIYTPDEDISLSLEYWDGNGKNVAIQLTTSGDNSDDSKLENTTSHRRYLRCTAAVTVAHLQKLIRLKYDLSTNYKVNIIHQNDVLSEDYTLVDVAYIYSWRRNGPMRFFYRIEEREPNLLKRLKLSEPEVNDDDVPRNSTDVEVNMDVDNVDCSSSSIVTNVNSLAVCCVPVTVNVTDMSPPPVTKEQVTPLLLFPTPSISKKVLLSKSRAVKATRPKSRKRTVKVPTAVTSAYTPIRLPKNVVVTLKALPEPPSATLTNKYVTSCNGDASREEVNLEFTQNSYKENCDSELSTTLVSIGTKGTKSPADNGVTNKDSMVVVVVASNEPPESPMSNNINFNNHLTISPSPPLPLPVPVPDISITPIPPSPSPEVPVSKPSLPREALLATTPQVEIIKKSCSPVSTTTITSVTNLSPSMITTNTILEPDVVIEMSDNIVMVPTEETTIEVAAVTNELVEETVTEVSPTTIVTSSGSDTVATVTTATTAAVTVTATTTTITITSTPSEGQLKDKTVTSPSDDALKHDNIGALDLSRNSRPSSSGSTSGSSSSKRSTLTTTSPTMSPRSPSSSRNSPVTFQLPSSTLLRVPTHAHSLQQHSTGSVNASSTKVAVTVPPFRPHSRSVPASLSSAAARPLFMTGRTPPPSSAHLPIGLNSLKSASGLNGLTSIRTYSSHNRHHGNHHGSSHHNSHHSSHHNGKNGSASATSGHGTGSGHSSRSVPKHILSAIGMLDVKKGDFVNRKPNVSGSEKSAVTDKPNFRNGNGKALDTTSSSV